MSAEAIILSRAQFGEMLAFAREAAPHECCGLMGGSGRRVATLYPLRNVAANPLVAYEAAAADLFAAQRRMRGRGEELLGIYHSHPLAAEPVPSASDVNLAFYPAAIYFIVGLAGAAAEDESRRIGAFRLYESEGRWERVAYRVAED